MLCASCPSSYSQLTAQDPSPTCAPSCTRPTHSTVDLTHIYTARSPVEDYLDLTRPLRDLESEDSDDDVEVRCLYLFPSAFLLTHLRMQFPAAEALISQV